MNIISALELSIISQRGLVTFIQDNECCTSCADNGDCVFCPWQDLMDDAENFIFDASSILDKGDTLGH